MRKPGTVHPEIQFDKSYDQKIGFHTKSMIVVPVKLKETFIGLLQLSTTPLPERSRKLTSSMRRISWISSSRSSNTTIKSPPALRLPGTTQAADQRAASGAFRQSRKREAVPGFLSHYEMRIEIDEIGESLERLPGSFCEVRPGAQTPHGAGENINQSVPD